MRIILSKRFTLHLAAASIIALVPASASLADPTLDDVHPHRHLLSTPHGVVAIGPDACDDPNLQNAFNQFHFNVHASGTLVDGVFVPIDTLGPVAPGLHDGQGADMTRPLDCD